MQALIRHFMRLIFHLAPGAQEQVNRLIGTLHLPKNYVAVHIRRGDKVGDEDIHYPVERYFEQLGNLDGQAVFVMSDDYRTVDEVREYLKAHNRSNRVVSLCRQEHSGFDIWKLRAGERFAGGKQVFEGEDAYRHYVWEETNRLLAETVIAAGARRFASTFRSNVGKTVWYLHEEPDACRLFQR